ncbi:MAG: HNH endonuclease signature motif containing protein [Geminicoccaceae bacterium]
MPGCGRADRRMIVDHIVELKDGGAPLARNNLRLTCFACHASKTIAERAKRMARRPGGL